mmetsp:Transcript_20726/g.39413  ORF Transcript_20726/g.39413 Transcript_20726/m.39413 type:complete len:221 (-) Transcript_20726:713-1375(-)
MSLNPHHSATFCAIVHFLPAIVGLDRPAIPHRPLPILSRLRRDILVIRSVHFPDSAIFLSSATFLPNRIVAVPIANAWLLFVPGSIWFLILPLAWTTFLRIPSIVPGRLPNRPPERHNLVVIPGFVVPGPGHVIPRYTVRLPMYLPILCVRCRPLKFGHGHDPIVLAILLPVHPWRNRIRKQYLHHEVVVVVVVDPILPFLVVPFPIVVLVAVPNFVIPK